MTIASTATRKEYVGNGVTTAFPFPYQFRANTDLVVWERTIATGALVKKTYGTDFTVTGAGDPSGGTVTATAAPANTVNWIIVRDPARTQGVALVNGAKIDVVSGITDPLDALTLMVQRQNDRADRSIHAPDGDLAATASMELPNSKTRAGYGLAFDANGLPQNSSKTDAEVSAAVNAVVNNSILANPNIVIDGVPTTITVWINDKLGNIFDYITSADHDALKAGADTTDLKDDIALAYTKRPLMEWGDAVFYTSESIDLTGIDGGSLIGCGANFGPTYDLDGGSGTRIIVTGSNIPGVRLMNASTLRDVAIRYQTEQAAANTAAIGVELNNWNRGHIDNLLVSGAAISVGVPQSNAPGKSYNSYWNSKIGTIASYNASLGHFDLRPYNAGVTNVVIDNLNLNGGGSVDNFTTPGKSCAFGIKAANLSGLTIGQVNLESLVCTGSLLDVSSGSNRFSITGFRAETVSFEAASNTPMFNLGGSKNRCRIEDIDLLWCRWKPGGNAPSSGDALYILKTVATKNELFAAVMVRSTCDFGGTGTRRILVNSCTDFTNSDIEIPFEDEGSQFSDASWSDTVTTRQSPVRKIGGYAAYEKFRAGKNTNFITTYYGNSAPAAADGTFALGDRWKIRAPSLGAITEYLCTTAGTVGSGGVFSESGRSPLTGSATYDPASLVDGAGVTTTVTVTGAAVGDFALASFSLDLQGVTLTAWVSATNTVSVRFQNESGGTLDLASGTLTARVIKST